MTSPYPTQYRRMMEKIGLRRYTRLCAENPRFELERYGRPNSYPDWREHDVLPPKVVETRYEIRKDLVA